MKFVVRCLSLILALQVVAALTPPLHADPQLLDLNTVAARIRPAVALLRVTRTTTQRICTGSGFFVSKDGKLVTNWHVVRDAASIKVTTAVGHALAAKVLAEDPEYDVALLQIEGAEDFPALELAGNDLAEKGLDIALVGSSMVREDRGLRRGIVAAIERIFGKWMIQISTPLQPGLSGSPLVNAEGQVIGVANGQFVGKTEQENVNFAVPVAPVRKLLARTAPLPAVAGAPSLVSTVPAVKLATAD